MFRRAWSLVIFTLWIQVSVGTFGALTIFQHWVSPLISLELLNMIMDSTLDVSALFLVSGVIAATFHLRKPNNAFYSILNIRSSWLSRETILGLIFGLGFMIFSILHWSRVGSTQLRSTSEILTLISGVVLVYTMSKVYRIRTVPTWNNILTSLAFFTTTLLLGTLAFGTVWLWQLPTIMIGNLQSSIIESSLHWIKSSLIILIVVQMLFMYLGYKKYKTPKNSLIVSFAPNTNHYRIGLIFRLGIGVIGVAIFSNYIDQLILRFDHTQFQEFSLIIAFLLVLASEIIGRFLFYASYKRFGL
jgi:anaerobic dimethyl sulfoxide reductase subunit C (anchor subunit)